jgi:hypothetical protein
MGIFRLFLKVIVNRSKGLARFALMHCIASSLCFWLYAIKNETIDSILEKRFFYVKNKCNYPDYSSHHDDDGGNFTMNTLNISRSTVDEKNHGGMCYTAETSDCLALNQYDFHFNISCFLANQCRCSATNDIARCVTESMKD